MSVSTRRRRRLSPEAAKRKAQLRRDRIAAGSTVQKDYSAAYREKKRGAVRWEMSRRLTYARERSRRKGLDCDLVIGDLLGLWESQKGRCALSGVEMTLGAVGGREPNLASIDRVDPSGGYTLGNVRLVTWVVNCAMQDWGRDEFFELCLKVVEFNGLARPS